MNFRTSHMIGVLALLAVSPLFGAAAQSSTIGEVYEKASGALSMIYCTVKEGDTTREVVGMGICIDSSGILMTLALDTRVDPASIQDCTVVLPGATRTTLKAKFLGMDTLTGLAFLQTEGSHQWSKVSFEPKAQLTIGQDVTSVGILEAAGAHTLYVGKAQVSSIIRIPETLAYVTGGRLTCPGSVVFSADGKAIGIVGRQLPLNSKVIADNKASLYAIQGIHETSFFTPTDEIAHLLDNIPTEGKVRGLSWIGVNKFDFVSGEAIGLASPAIMIEQVVPNSVGQRSGLKDRDLITAADGQEVEPLSTPHLTTQAFVRRLFKLQPGHSVRLTILRDGKPVTISVPVEEVPKDHSQIQSRQFLDHFLGLLIGEGESSAQPPVPGLSALESVRVLAATKDGPAMKAGLRTGDLITKVNDIAVENVAEYRRILEGVSQNPTEPIRLTIYRNDQHKSVTVMARRELP